MKGLKWRSIPALALPVLTGLAFVAGCGGSGEKVIMRDDFSHASSGWSISNDATSQEGYSDGAYRIFVKKRNWEEDANRTVNAVVPAVSVEVRAAELSGTPGDEIGVFCFVRPKRWIGYQFVIGPPDGYVAIRRALGGNRTQALKTKTLLHALRRGDVGRVGAANHLLATCQGRSRSGAPTQLTLTVNGHQVAHASDPHPFGPFRGVGLSVGSLHGGSEALFHNLVVRELPSQ